ncbi:Peroxisomal biogenesis factor [Lachnellula willkommii]|uniref:Peroxisomal ATPase PEX6 n=1 Tax=Lachnellula willkommii TaxID=215461 RepID=A0A559M3M4_9HELO|nr:Peroxisomal biogenesis factor [Lachnellula willkommii]
MADPIQIPHHRKRKRRRQDKSSITARLVLDGHVKGDVGILSEDLYGDLFPAQAYAQADDSPPQNDEVHHVAISPWEPSTAVEDSKWTVVPIRSSSALAHSTVQFSPSSLALQGFAAALQKVAPSKLSSHSRSGIEIRILDVIPVPLDTVFVTIERELASRLENGEGTFHGEHARTNGKPMAKTSATSPEERLSSAIREALGSLMVVHTGDDFPLPLQPHPITHIPPPPAKVTLSEPVGQGILSPQTKIIITQSGHLPKIARKQQSLAVNRQNGGSDDEDTSNDQFYSAAEDRYKTDTAVEDNDSATDTEADLSEEDNLSDDSMDDMISLQAPMLPAHNASGISTIQPGSPQTVGHRTNGIATPGSIFSSFTATTARAGGQKGRLFKAQGLMKPLAEEILHPKPSTEDDEESRVFVDVNSLSKIGCFSGDWVRLEVASEPPANGAGLWGLGSFGAEPEDPLWRPVKIFGLPEGYSHRPVTKIPSTTNSARQSKLSGVGWFKIVYIGVTKDETSDDEDIWGGAASIDSQRNIGKATLASKACADIGLHTYNIDAYDIMTEGRAGSDTNTIAYLETRAEKAMASDRMVTSLGGILSGLRVLIATTTEVDKIPDGVRGLFTHELEMSAPDEWEREGILRGIIDAQPIPLAPEVDLSGVAVKTAALVAGDLVDVVDRAIVGRNSRLESLASASSNPEKHVTVRDVLVAGGPAGRCLTKADFDLAVDAARKNFADAIGAPKIPNVSWDDVGGLTNVKDAVIETIQLPLERPELFAKGMKKRSGILFYGPPGTGKTLLAKAIATEFSLNFFSVKGPELLNMYIGESEANVRRVFQRARDARPCVVFFDELDSVAPKRGNQGDSGGVMDRIVSQLLAELDGMSDGEDGGGGVFVIGATNRPDLLDAALLRPGRFDKMLYLGVSDTHEKQLTIMEALTRKFTLHPSLSLQRVSSRLPFTYTGADFYALCSDAMLKAVTRQASLVDTKIAAINNTSTKISTAYFFDHYATKEDTDVVVMEEDFMLAEKELVPSVSFGELEHYKKVRGMFEKPDDGKGKLEADADVGVEETNGRAKSKGKAKVVDRKGKGKAVDSDDGGVTSNGVKGKGKGKAVDMGFRDGEDDDEGLY